MTIQFQKYAVEDVIDFFVKGFDPGKGKKIAKYEFNYDPHKGEIIIALFVEESKPESKS